MLKVGNIVDSIFGGKAKVVSVNDMGYVAVSINANGKKKASVKGGGSTKSTDPSNVKDSRVESVSDSNDVRTPKRGEIVEVRDDEKQEWKEAIYLCTIEGAYYKHQCVKRHWETQFSNGDLFDIRPYSEMRQKKPKEETIYVPDNIRIERLEYGHGMCGDGLCINNGKQSLCYYNNIYTVSQAYKEDEIKCKLIPIDVKDLEVGGTYYRSNVVVSNSKAPYINEIEKYCKCIGDKRFVFWNDEGIMVGCKSYDHRYKVIPID